MPAPPKRGAMPSPVSAINSAPRHITTPGAPPNIITIPAQLSAWGNSGTNAHGDCVTAEEAFAKACGSPEVFVPDSEVIAWASKNGYLEGATPSDVLASMAKSGFLLAPVYYDIGPYYSVDWKNAATLQSAIALGPVKLGVNSDQLETACNSSNFQNGWFGVRFKHESKQDHCVALCGYGTINWLAQQLHVQVPAGVDGSKDGYALFTWGCIGIIDVPSMLAITFEAWLRRPTTMRKVILGESSPLGPALASFDGKLYVAWKGDGNDHLNLMSSADGEVFAGKYISPENSPISPTLCAHNGSLYIGWKGDGNDNLNVARVEVSGTSITGFANKVTLSAQSPASPALASFDGNLFIAWKGDGNNHLNVMYSKDNGATFGNKYVSGETSVQAPCLCPESGSLCIGWRGVDNSNLNVARIVMNGAGIAGFGGKVTLPDSSAVGPAMAADGRKLYLAWKGDGNNNLNVESSTDSGASFGNKSTLAQTSSQAPAIASMNGKVYLAWKGDGNDNLSVACVVG